MLSLHNISFTSFALIGVAFQWLILRIKLVPYNLGNGAFGLPLLKVQVLRFSRFQILQQLKQIKLEWFKYAVFELGLENLVVPHKLTQSNAILFYKVEVGSEAFAVWLRGSHADVAWIFINNWGLQGLLSSLFVGDVNNFVAEQRFFLDLASFMQIGSFMVKSNFHQADQTSFLYFLFIVVLLVVIDIFLLALGLILGLL